MWSELDLEKMEREANAYAGARAPEEVQQLVVMTRLELYNCGKPCGPKAVRTRLRDHYALKPLPAERTVAPAATPLMAPDRETRAQRCAKGYGPSTVVL